MKAKYEEMGGYYYFDLPRSITGVDIENALRPVLGDSVTYEPCDAITATYRWFNVWKRTQGGSMSRVHIAVYPQTDGSARVKVWPTPRLPGLGEKVTEILSKANFS